MTRAPPTRHQGGGGWGRGGEGGGGEGGGGEMLTEVGGGEGGGGGHVKGPVRTGE